MDASGERVGNALCKVPSAYCYAWQKEVSGLLVKTEGRDVQKRRESGVCLEGQKDVDGVEDVHTQCVPVCAYKLVVVSACHKHVP